ncbi:MAG: FtsW/RodA/SpoVE family cell cycle protein, partial [Actinomycetota bacterium]
MSTTFVPQRRTGLWLLLGALVIALGASLNVGLAKRGRVPVNLALYGSIMAAGYLGCWLVIRRYARDADPVLFPLGGLLAGLGFAVIFRLDGGLAAEQATWLLVALVAFTATLLLIRDDRQLDALTYTIGLAALVLLILPVVPGIGAEINGARLWIR